MFKGLVTKGADVLLECPESEVTHVDWKIKVWQFSHKKKCSI